jgi:cysteine-rich repeat protein
MCPAGSFVIGFDAGANIICSGICGNGVLDPGEACDDGNVAGGDGCSTACRREGAKAPVTEQQAVAAPVPGTRQSVSEAASAAPTITGGAAAISGAAVSVAAPEVADIEPSAVVFGSREVTLTITGSGFNANTVVRFGGSDYNPVVSNAGTRLVVTLPVRNLAIGPYQITVSNGPGRETTLRRALEVF